MLEEPEFVPMARPYASDTLIYLFLYKSRLRKLCTKPPSPGQRRPMNGQDQYAPDRGAGGSPEFHPFSNDACANFGILRSSVWSPLAGQFGVPLEVNFEVVELSRGSLGTILEVSWGS